MIPALKRTVAHYSGNESWARLRPPLVEMDAAQSAALIDGLTERGFAMPGLA
jgi:4-hydroxy-tetrahydrodipicolinate synthase